MNLSELNRRIKDVGKRQIESSKTRYRWLRDIGFTSGEAAILQNRSRETVFNIAKEKGIDIKSMEDVWVIGGKQ